MIPHEHLTLYLVANASALAILALAFWRHSAARWAGAAVFAWAAVTNAWTALARPSVYVEYATLTPSAIYRGFIAGWFSDHVRVMVLPIAIAQAVIAILLTTRSPVWQRLGVAAACIFLLAIAPLGVGSGFPFSLTFGAALLVSVGAADVASQPARQVIQWIPRAMGVLLAAFLGVFALDAFEDATGVLNGAGLFAIHLVPAMIAAGVVVIAWRHQFLGGLLYLGLGVAYAAWAGGRVSWILVISLPLVVEGVLFLWSASPGRGAKPGVPTRRTASA